jgi:catechol 2,3-dioxygenase-like lactoylglutathione lyase family enzyme
MITGIHAIVYAKDPDKTRAFFRDVLGLPSVDAGHGWLIFALPPAEIAAHPADGDDQGHHELYLMCDDIEATVDDLTRKGVVFSRPIVDRGWGRLATLELPGGGELSIYQPRHPTAIALPR